MTNYVLVHGAWHGGWCWRRVCDLLAGGGHRVFAPTLTGLGSRSHLLSRDIGLATHVVDVANLILWEELEEVVLVGHSYGCHVVRHVADWMPERLRALVYLDGNVPDDGQSLIDCWPDGGEAFRAAARNAGDGWKLPPPPAAVMGVNVADAAWVDRLCTPHPFRTFEEPARLHGACDRVSSIGYIRTTQFPIDVLAETYRRAGERGWWRAEIASGHDAMIDQPDELVRLLEERT